MIKFLVEIFVEFKVTFHAMFMTHPVRRGRQFRRHLAGTVLAAWLCAALPGHAGATDWRAEIAAREQTAVRNVNDGVRDFAAFEATTAAAPLAVRRDVLLRIRRLQRDVGDFDGARATNARLRALGESAGDAQARGEADLGDIDDDIRAYRVDAAKQAQARFMKRYDLATLPELAYHAHNTFGRLDVLASAFDAALSHFQSALDLSDKTPEPVAARVESLGYLAYLYLPMKQPKEAARYVDAAFAADDGSMRPRLRSYLYFTRALALIGMDRLDDAERAMNDALRIARAAEVWVMQAHVLGNLADLALRRQHWVDAEAAARGALAASQRINDQSAVMLAKANLGFALGGQGRLDAALPYLDEVTEHFRSHGNVQLLGGTLEEKAAMYERLGMYKEAMAVLREFQRIERKQFSTERTNAVAALQEKFEQAENRRRIEHLQQENRLKDEVIHNREVKQAALAGVVLLAAAVVGLVLVLYRRAGRSNGELRSLNARLEYMAVRDPLTGLFNRRSFVDKMGTRAEQGPADRRAGDRDGGDIFLVLDIDHFKRVNDTYGHGAGDQVLVEVARRLQQSVRESDMILRWVARSSSCIRTARRAVRRRWRRASSTPSAARLSSRAAPA
jgi:tetratricopeptide (TPR) repeat protein